MRGMSFTSMTRKLCLVIWRVTSTMGVSWKASDPISLRGTCGGENNAGSVRQCVCGW